MYICYVCIILPQKGPSSDCFLHSRKCFTGRMMKNIFLCCSGTVRTPNYILCLVHVLSQALYLGCCTWKSDWEIIVSYGRAVTTQALRKSTSHLLEAHFSGSLSFTKNMLNLFPQLLHTGQHRAPSSWCFSACLVQAEGKDSCAKPVWQAERSISPTLGR